MNLNEIAQIEIYNNVYSYDFYLDGRKVASLGKRQAAGIRVEPGKHTLSAQTVFGIKSNSIHVNLSAQETRKYGLVVTKVGYGLWVLAMVAIILPFFVFKVLEHNTFLPFFLYSGGIFTVGVLLMRKMPGLVHALLEIPPSPDALTSVVETSREILLAQPADYPHELVDALKELFKTKPEIKRGWLAVYFDPTRDIKQRLLIGLDVTDNWNNIASEALAITRTIPIPEDRPIDFLRFGENNNVDTYFSKNTKPFYQG